MVPDVKMGLFPRNDDIQKVLNFYKPPIHIFFNAHSVTSGNYDTWNRVFVLKREKSVQKVLDSGDEQSCRCFFLRKKNASTLQENLRKKYLNLTDADGNARNALLVAW